MLLLINSLRLSSPFVAQECGCIDRGNATELANLDMNVHTMNDGLHGLAAKWRDTLAADGREDMAVVVQSFQEGIGATLDPSFLNKLDCFHPSTVAHEDLAIGLCVPPRARRPRASCARRLRACLRASSPARCARASQVEFDALHRRPEGALRRGLHAKHARHLPDYRLEILHGARRHSGSAARPPLVKQRSTPSM